MAEIKLTRGYVAIVDDEDYERINSYNWFANVTTFPNGRVRVRAARMRNRQMIYMHHEVLGILPSSLDGDHVDHEDGDSLNNRKKNLTVKTPMQNSHNTKRHKERKGYCFNKRVHRWYCYIDEPGKPRKNIGYAATESEAKAKVEAYRDAHR
jgi:hypothetical protein